MLLGLRLRGIRSSRTCVTTHADGVAARENLRFPAHTRTLDGGTCSIREIEVTVSGVGMAGSSEVGVSWDRVASNGWPSPELRDAFSRSLPSAASRY